nr:Chain A, microcin J25 [Escherichia coli]7LL7_A Chain A, GLY-GLY-ALA-GLY-HIS-VAL-PRO-GLU-TYR-PHE [Escherichia coli]
GGAGHVPEYF